MNIRKDNHYVPQLYLKQWVTNGKVPTYRLLVPNNEVSLWKDHSLRGIAFHQHLYTYLADQEETDEFESWLSQEFEAPAEEAIRLAIHDKQMSQDHWGRLVRFAVAQDVRTPASLRKFLDRHRDTMQGLMNEALDFSVRKLEDAANAGVALPIIEPDAYNALPLKVSITRNPDGDGSIETKTVVGRRLWLWSVRHLLTHTINSITNTYWTILHAPAGISWPTSDNPLIKLNYYEKNRYDFGGGWGVPKVDIILPLSPKHLLHNSIGQRSWPRRTTLDMQTAQFIRKAIIEHADRYVFDKEKSDIQLIRPRLVCPATYNEERMAWQNWGKEQSKAEAGLSG